MKTKPHTPLWTKELDARLMDLVADGLKFDAIANIMGRAKDNCAARFRRLAKEMGAQAV